MNKTTLINYLRSFLSRLLESLNRLEDVSPRGQKEPWYKKEFHIPPILVGLTTAFVLYLVLFLRSALSLAQASALAIFVVLLVVLFSIYLLRDQKELVKNDEAMALLSVLFFLDLLAIKIIAIYSHKYFWITPFLTPVSIAPLLTALLLNPRLAMVLSFVVALIFGMLNDFSFPLTMVGTMGGVTMVAAGSRSKSAHQVARAGIWVGLVQALVVLFLAVLFQWSKKSSMVAIVSSFVSGITSAIIGLGLMPYLESIFSRISNLRLLELAAVDHPLLQKLSMEAPGTYHHSLIVASLAEDAANAIGANGLLCRVGAYFHDIGKMVKAEYFIENQGTFGNPHDQVSPSLSRLVITSHVKEGMALARAHKLDPKIIDFIPQHHGTSKIEFFYLKALKLEKQEEESDQEDVEEMAYRYPGPKPQSKETGIVMLADSVEATSRTLEEPNHQRYKDMVHKIINKKLFDGQMDETPLTLKDLHVMAERFTATLTSIHHARIAYPEAESLPKDAPGELTTLQ